MIEQTPSWHWCSCAYGFAFRSGGFERGSMSNRQSSSSYQPRNWSNSRDRGQARGEFTRYRPNRDPGPQREQCWRCTSNYHSPEKCFAIGKMCRHCQEKGHIERACTAMLPDKTKRHFTEEGEPSSYPKVRKIAAIMATENSDEDKSLVEKKPVSATFSSENSE